MYQDYSLLGVASTVVNPQMRLVEFSGCIKNNSRTTLKSGVNEIMDFT